MNRIAVVEETATDEQVLINEMAGKPDDPEITVPMLVTHPVKITSVPTVGPKRAPDLGEHSAEIPPRTRLRRRCHRIHAQGWRDLTVRGGPPTPQTPNPGRCADVPVRIPQTRIASPR